MDDQESFRNGARAAAEDTPDIRDRYATKSYDIGQDDGVERAGEGSSEEVTRRLDRFEKQAPAREK